MGFFRKVRCVKEGTPREDCGSAALISRLKCRQTTLDISDLSEDVSNAKTRAAAGLAASLQRELAETLSMKLDEYLNASVSPDRFEKIVLRFFQMIGGDASLLPRNQSGKDAEGIGDVDVRAEFPFLGVTILVQAKKHDAGTQTDGFSVQQIAAAEEPDEVQRWVITTADDFTEDAKKLAQEKGVRLIARDEFVRMYIDAGAPALQSICGEI